jgi:Protein of unknown function (DUF938)
LQRLHVLPTKGVILEIASGSGEHVVHFARNLPSLVFQPSDREPDALESVAAWVKATRVTNVRAPVILRLEEAVAAYRAALQELTRDRVPLGWAATQMNRALTDDQSQLPNLDLILHRRRFGRSDHRCHRIRAFSSGMATPSRCGISRAV